MPRATLLCAYNVTTPGPSAEGDALGRTGGRSRGACRTADAARRSPPLRVPSTGCRALAPCVSSGAPSTMRVRARAALRSSWCPPMPREPLGGIGCAFHARARHLGQEAPARPGVSSDEVAAKLLHHGAAIACARPCGTDAASIDDPRPGNLNNDQATEPSASEVNEVRVLATSALSLAAPPSALAVLRVRLRRSPVEMQWVAARWIVTMMQRVRGERRPWLRQFKSDLVRPALTVEELHLAILLVWFREPPDPWPARVRASARVDASPESIGERRARTSRGSFRPGAHFAHRTFERRLASAVPHLPRT